MKAVLRIALTFFSVETLQGWMSTIGAGLVFVSLVTRLLDADGSTLASLGAGLIALIPAVAGGTMLRHGSSDYLLHLRPWGRLRMLLAATLVITLLAALATMPILTNTHGATPHASADHPFDRVSALQMFEMNWSAVVLVWLAAFAIAGSRILPISLPFVSLVLLGFGRKFATFAPSALAIFAAGLAVWAAFALWYLRARSIQRPADETNDRPRNLLDMLHWFLQLRSGAAQGAMSLEAAASQYLLGTSSPARYALLGATWIFLVMLLVVPLASVLLGNASTVRTAFGTAPDAIVPIFFAMAGASLGFRLTRRARLLWLRAGLGRGALFAHTERCGLVAGVFVLGVTVICLLAFTLVNQPGDAAATLIFVAAHFVCAICFFYGGLSLTLGWEVQDVLLCLGLFVLFLIETSVFPASTDLRAAMPTSMATMLVHMASMLLIGLLLRWHAKRRWRVLDWRIARLPRTGRTIT